MQSVHDFAKTFDDFIKDYHRFDDGQKLLVNQAEYIMAGNRCLVDYVARFEKLKDEFEFILKRIHEPVGQGTSHLRLIDEFKLNHLNASDHVFYRDFYTQETREIVACRFAHDIELFQYEF